MNQILWTFCFLSTGRLGVPSSWTSSCMTVLVQHSCRRVQWCFAIFYRLQASSRLNTIQSSWCQFHSLGFPMNLARYENFSLLGHLILIIKRIGSAGLPLCFFQETKSSKLIQLDACLAYMQSWSSLTWCSTSFAFPHPCRYLIPSRSLFSNHWPSIVFPAILHILNICLVLILNLRNIGVNCSV